MCGALAAVGDRLVSDRAQRLRRLFAIRRLNEDLDRRSLQGALAAVAEVEEALGRQEGALTDARAATRCALAEGDRSELLLAEAQREVAGRNRGSLRVVLAERASIVPLAMVRFLSSRMEHEQVKQLVEDARHAALLDGDRKAQAASDDWYLSKRSRATRASL